MRITAGADGGGTGTELTGTELTDTDTGTDTGARVAAYVRVSTPNQVHAQPGACPDDGGSA